MSYSCAQNLPISLILQAELKFLRIRRLQNYLPHMAISSLVHASEFSLSLVQSQNDEEERRFLWKFRLNMKWLYKNFPYILDWPNGYLTFWEGNIKTKARDGGIQAWYLPLHFLDAKFRKSAIRFLLLLPMHQSRHTYSHGNSTYAVNYN
jgi:hypothetical protein